jgi:hypothetical protein
VVNTSRPPGAQPRGLRQDDPDLAGVEVLDHLDHGDAVERTVEIRELGEVAQAAELAVRGAVVLAGIRDLVGQDIDAELVREAVRIEHREERPGEAADVEQASAGPPRQAIDHALELGQVPQPADRVPAARDVVVVAERDLAVVEPGGCPLRATGRGRRRTKRGVLAANADGGTTKPVERTTRAARHRPTRPRSVAAVTVATVSCASSRRDCGSGR